MRDEFLILIHWHSFGHENKTWREIRSSTADRSIKEFLKSNIHDYFFVKALSLVKLVGGLRIDGSFPVIVSLIAAMSIPNR